MKALCDSDLLSYQVAFGAQRKDDETGEVVIKNFDSCVELLEQVLREIQEEAWCDEEPVMYFTGDEKLLKLRNKSRKREGKEALDFKPNFRFSIAKTKPYKGNRHQDKPFHFDNVRAYILAKYKNKIAWGMEADDLLCVDHRKDPENTMIVSRDKDLKICPGKHYGWSCGGAPSFGPVDVDELGHVELNAKRKLKGVGLKFFYSQLITGDTTDNIPGIEGKGDVYAHKIIDPCTSEAELHSAVAAEYIKKYDDKWEDYFLEQARLLWMVQELDEDNNPVMFIPFDRR